jgi:hypothetical protein
MDEIRSYIVETYDRMDKFSDGDDASDGARSDMERYGFYLSPAETRWIDGEKYYRVIFPTQPPEKGGWSKDYETPIADHIEDDDAPASHKAQKPMKEMENPLYIRQDMDNLPGTIATEVGDAYRTTRDVGKGIYHRGKAAIMAHAAKKDAIKQIAAGNLNNRIDLQHQMNPGKYAWKNAKLAAREV